MQKIRDASLAYSGYSAYWGVDCAQVRLEDSDETAADAHEHLLDIFHLFAYPLDNLAFLYQAVFAMEWKEAEDVNCIDWEFSLKLVDSEWLKRINFNFFLLFI